MKTTGKQLVKARPLLWTVLVALVSGWSGYWLHERGTDGSRSRPATWMPGVEYLTRPQSFSRVENARNSLEALCVRVRLEIQNGIMAHAKSPGVLHVSSAEAELPLDRVIHDCEQVMRDFEGTDQEVYLAQDLLWALKKTRRFDRWTEVYLKALYEHPTHPVVGCLAQEAITIGRLAGQEREVFAGLEHLSAIPIEFENKDRIRAALHVGQRWFGATHFESSASTVLE